MAARHLLPRPEESHTTLKLTGRGRFTLGLELLLLLTACVTRFAGLDHTPAPAVSPVAPSTTEGESTPAQETHKKGEDIEVVPQSQHVPKTTCINPSPEQAASCREIEEQILRSTVRICLESWVVKPDESGYEIDHSTGHATVIDGRSLMTHNHFGAPMAIRACDSQTEAYGIIILLDGAGQELYRGPVTDFEVVWEDPVTLVLAYKEAALFEQLGLTPAEFLPWSAIPWAAGMEVAQIDWDGETTRVDWTTVEAVRFGVENPWLQLADPVTRGASGGGIYWQGYHVASNWLLEKCVDSDGYLVSAVTRGAIDHPQFGAPADE